MFDKEKEWDELVQSILQGLNSARSPAPSIPGSVDAIEGASDLISKPNPSPALVAGELPERLEGASSDVVDGSWGIYFELVTEKDAAFADSTNPCFPHALCSFETKATVGLSPMHLNIAWGATETLTVEGREWSYDGHALEQASGLQQLHRVVGAGTIKGYMSPLHEVNLDENAKEMAGIPSNARYFMFSYPASIMVKGISMRPPRHLSDPDLAFLRNGGYVYFDESMKSIVRMNAILPASEGALRFGPPLKWEADWSKRLIHAGRFRPITIDEISQSGATHFCWIRPNEVMWFEKSGGSPICPLGGFAYICRGSATGSSSGGESTKCLKRRVSEIG